MAIVQPETILRWHRAGFRLFWRHRSRSANLERRVPAETIGLIRDMATRKRLWGAEHIRGELLTVGTKVSKRTVQKYMRSVRERRGRGQTWATFVKKHADDIWCCDVVQHGAASSRHRPTNSGQPHHGNDNHHGKIIATPVLGSFHHDYQRAA